MKLYFIWALSSQKNSQVIVLLGLKILFYSVLFMRSCKYKSYWRLFAKMYSFSLKPWKPLDCSRKLTQYLTCILVFQTDKQCRPIIWFFKSKFFVANYYEFLAKKWKLVEHVRKSTLYLTCDKKLFLKFLLKFAVFD